MYKIILVLPLILLSGCATIVEGKSQTVSVSTEPADAICTLQSPAIGTMSVKTPDTITLTKSKHDIAIQCKKECYEDVTGILPSSFEGMTFGNILFGGVIGVAVDASTGAMNNYEPSISIPLTKLPNCTPAA